MPRATIASRQLKNKDTGIDLFVTTYKETKGLMKSTVHYQVVLVSNLACFKTPSHKESDVVQYSIEKQWSEFEELRIKVAEIFQGTALPTLNKLSIIVNEHVLRERRNSLDHFLKFLASVPKLATSKPLLQFLGVNSGRAKRFGQGEPLESVPKASDDNKEEGNAEANESEVYVFEDSVNDQDEEALFDDVDDVPEDDVLFGAENDRAQVSMFEEQDLKRELTEEDEKDFGFIPDAIITKREVIKVNLDESEDSADLLTIEDDLDKLMTIDVDKKETQLQPQQKENLILPAAPSTEKPRPPTKPSPAPKPKPATQPNVLNKSISQGGSELPPKESSAKPAPRIKPKPTAKPQSSISQQHSSNDNTTDGKSVTPEIVLTGNAKESGSVDTLDQDDIMKYLRENSSADTEDVDLFS